MKMCLDVIYSCFIHQHISTQRRCLAYKITCRWTLRR